MKPSVGAELCSAMTWTGEGWFNLTGGGRTFVYCDGLYVHADTGCSAALPAVSNGETWAELARTLGLESRA